MTCSKVLVVISISFALGFLPAAAQELHDESQSGKEPLVFESENSITGDVIPKQLGDRQYEFEVTMQNYENEPVKVLQEMITPFGVEVISYTLTTTEAGAASEEQVNDQVRSTTGGVINILAGQTTAAQLTYVNHPALTFNPSNKKFHRISANIDVRSDGLVGGEISTPNYPNSYPNGAEITWTITYPPKNKIRFEMLDYSMEKCCDHLTVYEGTDMTLSVLATFYGDFSAGESNVVISSQPAIFVSFNSDCMVSGSGFRASYINQPDIEVTTAPSQDETTAVYYNPEQCSGISDANIFSSLTSPGYNSPGWYPSDQSCHWRIEVSPGYVVSIDILYFQTQYNVDWVYIYNGYSTSSSDKIASITGYVDPYTLAAETDTNQATVTFLSDCCFPGYPGFELYITYRKDIFTTVPPQNEMTTSSNAICSSPEYLAGSSGYVSSPDYPNNYSSNLNCSYFIQTPYGTTVGLYLQSFSVIPGDYLAIYDAHTGDLIGQLVGNIIYNYHIATNTDYVQLVFTTDSDPYTVDSGFYIRYDAESYSTTVFPTQYNCGANMPGDSGKITTTGYPYYAYSDNLDCLWTVQVTPGMYVLFTINFFRTEECCDYVDFYKGTPYNSLGLVEKYQGLVAAGTEVLVQDNDAYLVFHTDGSVSDAGFSISYSAVNNNYTSNSNGASYVAARRDSAQYHQYKVGHVGSPAIIGRDLWEGSKNRPSTKERDEETKP